MHLTTVFVVALVVASPMAGCIVPDNAQTLREGLGYASIDEPIVKIRASSLRPVVRETVELSVAVIGGVGPYTYTWTLPTGSAAGEAVEAVFSTPGTYEIAVSVASAKGAVGTDRVALEVGTNTAPVAVAMVAGEPRAMLGEAFTFTADGSSDAEADELTYLWAFDDGTTEAGMIVQHVFKNAGPHVATVTVDDGVDATTKSIGVAVDRTFEGSGAIGPTTTLTLPVEVSTQARELVATVSFTRPLMLEQVEAAWIAPDGTRSVAVSDEGLGTATGVLVFPMPGPATGAWTLEVKSSVGLIGDADATILAAYLVPR